MPVPSANGGGESTGAEPSVVRKLLNYMNSREISNPIKDH